MYENQDFSGEPFSPQLSQQRSTSLDLLCSPRSTSLHLVSTRLNSPNELHGSDLLSILAPSPHPTPQCSLGFLLVADFCGGLGLSWCGLLLTQALPCQATGSLLESPPCWSQTWSWVRRSTVQSLRVKLRVNNEYNNIVGVTFRVILRMIKRWQPIRKQSWKHQILDITFTDRWKDFHYHWSSGQ